MGRRARAHSADDLTKQLNRRGFSVLLTPRFRYPPLTVIGVRGRNYVELGALPTLARPHAPAPNIERHLGGVGAKALRTSTLARTPARRILRAIVEAAGGNLDEADLARLATLLTLRIGHVVASRMEASLLDTYLAAIDPDVARRRLFGDYERVLVVLESLGALASELQLRRRPGVASPFPSDLDRILAPDGRLRMRLPPDEDEQPLALAFRSVQLDLSGHRVTAQRDLAPRDRLIEVEAASTLGGRQLQRFLGTFWEGGLGGGSSSSSTEGAEIRVGGAGDLGRGAELGGGEKLDQGTEIDLGGAELAALGDALVELGDGGHIYNGIKLVTGFDGDALVELGDGGHLDSEESREPEKLVEHPADREPAASARDTGQAERRVGVGFSADGTPAVAIPATASLAPATFYWMFCEIGETVADAIGGGLPLSTGVPQDADLDVILFADPGGFELEHRSATLRLSGASARVLVRAGIPAVDADLVARRAFFRVKTPTAPCRAELRVHLYHKGLLVHAVRVGVSVADSPPSQPMSQALEYVLSDGLSPAHLASLGDHSLSVLVADVPQSRRGFRFFAKGGELAASAVLDAHATQSLLDAARDALRAVSWGEPVPYDPNKHADRHRSDRKPPDLRTDLVRLAQCGFRVWDAIVDALANGDVEKLRGAMRLPGVIQLGLDPSSRLLVPLALVYDYDFDASLPLEGYTLCPQYAIDPGRCFDGACPSRVGHPAVVCPSGFWGFRHAIGVPVSPSNGTKVASVVGSGQLRVLASVYADEFVMRDAHLTRVATLVGSGAFEKKVTRSDTLDALKLGNFQVLYFYCHGGIDASGAPYLRVGMGGERPNQIWRDTLRASRISWGSPQALVVINGCHTTAIEPRQAIDLVNGFIGTAHASGVIGTEITIFEPLAVAMGEELLKNLLAGKNVGFALRDARRAILTRDANPLGLVYVAFALATLSLDGWLPSRTA